MGGSPIFHPSIFPSTLLTHHHLKNIAIFFTGWESAHLDDVDRLFRLIGDPAPDFGADDVLDLLEHIPRGFDDVGVHLGYKLNGFAQSRTRYRRCICTATGGSAVGTEPLQPVFQLIVPTDTDALLTTDSSHETRHRIRSAQRYRVQ